MTTAVDTSVLFDLLVGDPRFAETSETALRKARANGRLVVCEAVVAELKPSLPDGNDLKEFLDDLGIDFEAGDCASAMAAGEKFARYLANRGPVKRVLPDFLVAAHARRFADALISRDRGYYREYFKDLEVIDPSRE